MSKRFRGLGRGRTYGGDGGGTVVFTKTVAGRLIRLLADGPTNDREIMIGGPKVPQRVASRSLVCSVRMMLDSTWL